MGRNTLMISGPAVTSVRPDLLTWGLLTVQMGLLRLHDERQSAQPAMCARDIVCVKGMIACCWGTACPQHTLHAAVVLAQDDLKAAFLVTRTTRTSLKQAGDEVMRNLRVAGQTRRKQGYLELLEVCMKIKRARELQATLR